MLWKLAFFLYKIMSERWLSFSCHCDSAMREKQSTSSRAGSILQIEPRRS